MDWAAELFTMPLLAAAIARSPEGQPIRRDFGISQTSSGRSLEIVHRDLAHWPFCALSEFVGTLPGQNCLLLVTPLSGHFASISREMVLGLVPTARVCVTDWLNARFVPASAGDFGFDENIETIVESIKLLGRGTHIVALCQGVVPALAAAAILSRDAPALAPRSLTLIGGPVDPLGNPTHIVEQLGKHTLSAIEAEALHSVGDGFPGAGRLVYPASNQLPLLLAYLYRHVLSGGELLQKVLSDDGLDPVRFPFFVLFTSLMDLSGKYFLENIQKVFLERQPWNGRLRWHGDLVDFGAVRETALMTIEGEDDDIAAPGQTSAAHRLCPNIPDGMRRRLIVSGAGHFSLFYGKVWREKILPEIVAFQHAHSIALPCFMVAEHEALPLT